MRRKRSDGDIAPLTLGKALTAQVRLIVWCKACGHRAEPEVAEQVSHHGSGMTVIDWAARLRCQDCGERSADFVVSGASLYGRARPRRRSARPNRRQPQH